MEKTSVEMLLTVLSIFYTNLAVLVLSFTVIERYYLIANTEERDCKITFKRFFLLAFMVFVANIIISHILPSINEKIQILSKISPMSYTVLAHLAQMFKNSLKTASILLLIHFTQLLVRDMQVFANLKESTVAIFLLLYAFLRPLIEPLTNRVFHNYKRFAHIFLETFYSLETFIIVHIYLRIYLEILKLTNSLPFVANRYRSQHNRFMTIVKTYVIFVFLDTSYNLLLVVSYIYQFKITGTYVDMMIKNTCFVIKAFLLTEMLRFDKDNYERIRREENEAKNREKRVNSERIVVTQNASVNKNVEANSRPNRYSTRSARPGLNEIR